MGGHRGETYLVLTRSGTDKDLGIVEHPKLRRLYNILDRRSGDRVVNVPGFDTLESIWHRSQLNYGRP
jgi:hypothetical protein